MPLKIPIKASSITNLTDGRYFAAVGAEWLGFNLHPESSHYLPIQDALEIKGWLSGPRYVAEMDTLPVEMVNETATLLQVGVIQTDLDLETELLNPSIQSIIRRIELEKFSDPASIITICEKNASVVSHFILDFSEREDTWEQIEKGKHTLNIDFLKSLCEKYNVLLQMYFTADNIDRILSSIAPLGISLVGGSEIQVGMKAYDRIDPVIELLELEEEF